MFAKVCLKPDFLSSRNGSNVLRDTLLLGLARMLDVYDLISYSVVAATLPGINHRFIRLRIRLHACHWACPPRSVLIGYSFFPGASLCRSCTDHSEIDFRTCARRHAAFLLFGGRPMHVDLDRFA